MTELNLDSMTTDFGNERRMLYLYPGDLLYDTPNKQWYLWNEKTGIWERDTKGQVAELVKEMIRGIQTEAAAMQTRAEAIDTSTTEGIEKALALKGIAEALLKWAHKCQNPTRVEACLKLVQSSVAVLPDDFNRDNHLFNCHNGTLNLKTMQLVPHNKDNRITFSCGWDYNPKAKCPKFQAFISRLFEHHKEKNDLIRFVQMALGYCLSGDTDQQPIEMLIGPGMNGKSVLLASMAVSFGDYAGTLNGESLTTTSRGKVREDLAQLVGKRFVSVSEVGKGSTIDEEVVKHVTGGSREPLKVRKFYGSFFDFFPKCKIFWSFNHLPKVQDMTHSLWRRIKVVPFEEVISDAEKREMNEIISEHDEERSGILNWLIAGFNDLIKTGNFNWCNAVKTRTNEYKEDVDDLKPFMDEVLERWIPAEHIDQIMPLDFKEKASVVHDCYLGWAFEHGYTRPKSLTEFGTEITERIGRENKERSGSGIYYLGLKIKAGIKYENPRKLQMQRLRD